MLSYEGRTQVPIQHDACDAGSIPPGYCHRFRSVTCNELNQVTHLDLAHLKGKGLKVKSKLSLNRLLQLAAKLPALQVGAVQFHRAVD